jgi:hypothetical protein
LNIFKVRDHPEGQWQGDVPSHSIEEKNLK